MSAILHFKCKIAREMRKEKAKKRNLLALRALENFNVHDVSGMDGLHRGSLRDLLHLGHLCRRRRFVERVVVQDVLH